MILKNGIHVVCPAADDDGDSGPVRLGHSAKGEPVEAVNYRVRSTVKVPKFSMRKDDRNLGSIDSAKVADREVFFNDIST